MKIEKLGQGDAARLAELEQSAFEHPWSAHDLEAELEKVNALALAIAGPAGEPAAYALFATVVDEAELLRIATRPEARRQGLGKALLEAGLERLEAAGIGSVFLEVDEGNEPARHLYQSLGFSEVGRREGYYRSGGAAVLYRRNLRLPDLLD